MAKPLLLSAGNGKVSEFVGTAMGQTVVWNDGSDEWVAGVQAYDLPVEIPGAPATSTQVVNFKAVRAFKLLATLHQGGQLVNPATNVTFTVKKNESSIGTLTFASTGTFAHVVTATDFAVADILTVTTQSTSMGALDTPYFTLAMTVS